uniref:Unkown protein n=1 Tax=Riptortus pedestris TaxID=329032 RepID=R4WDT5_RIPPE|nr:unkown protein [Riptortus pedestris]
MSGMYSGTGKNILALYKDLLKYGKSLTLTDKDYFLKRVKFEFRNNQFLTSKKDIEFHYNRGKELLKLKRIV